MELPEHIQYLWDWFCELSAGRTCGMAVNPITYPEIEAWKRVTGRAPAPWEVAAIKAVDKLFLESSTEDE